MSVTPYLSPTAVDAAEANVAPLDPSDAPSWNEQRLAAVLRAAQTEIAVLQGEIQRLTAQIDAQGRTIHDLNYQLYIRNAELDLHWEAQRRLHAEIARLSDADLALHRKDRHIRRLRMEMRALQDFIAATEVAEAETHLATRRNQGQLVDAEADIMRREQALLASQRELARAQSSRIFRFASFYWSITRRVRRLLGGA